jgi:hypothetical protein
MPAVAESFGLPPAPHGELPRPSDEAKRIVDAVVAKERNFAPLSVDRYGLVVAVAEPLAPDVEQELAFALALPIAQKIAPYVRIREALARDYGVPLERRLQRLLGRLRGERPGRSTVPPKNVDVRPPPRPPSVVPQAPRAKPAEPVRPIAAGGGKTLVREMDVAPSMRPVKRRRGPLTPDVAKTELEEADQRDAIFDLVFEFARQFFDYTVLFVVHGEVAEGRDAFGDGASRDKVARIGVPLDLPGLLSTAREQKVVFRKIPAPDGIDAVMMGDLGRSGTTECVVMPIVVRTRVVALLFGDGGESGLDEKSLVDVKSIVNAATAAFERLIVRRKLKGGAAGGSAKPPGGPQEEERRAEPEPPPPLRSAPEELAPPVRDLIEEPLSTVATTREPTVEAVLPPPDSPGVSIRSKDAPPPPNLLSVRRPAGPPIPREEPEPKSSAAAHLQKAAPPGPQRTRSQALRRAEAPALEFRGGGSGAAASIGVETFARDDMERQLLAEIHGQEISPLTARDEGAFGRKDTPAPKTLVDLPPPGSVEEPPPSPKAESPPPMRVSPAGDVSSMGLPVLHDEDKSPTSSTLLSVQDVTLVEPSPPAPIGMEGLLGDPDATPIAPAVTDHDATPIAPPVSAAGTPLAPPVSSSPLVSSMPRVPESPRAMPPSEQQISVAAHRPPSSRSDHSRVLPSVIVDVSSEYVALVQRALSGTDDDAEAELVRAGGYAMPAIMAKFPGPVTIERDRLENGALPRVGDCGPILRVIASQRRTALPFVLAHVDDPDVDKRFWATYLLTELVYPDTIEPVFTRIFDESPRVRRVARAAARALAEVHPAALVERLEPIARNVHAATKDRALAIEALGEMRDPRGVPILMKLLDDAPAEITAAARGGLVTITRQDFGFSLAKWQAWWTENKDRHRLEWLIDSLMHEHAALRAAASEELKTITKEYFGYYDDLPKRERERAQSRYREWWQTTGKVRFSTASSRRG